MKNSKRIMEMKNNLAVTTDTLEIINPDATITVMSKVQLNQAFCSVCRGEVTDPMLLKVRDAVGAVGNSNRTVSLIKCLTDSIDLGVESGAMSIVDGKIVWNEDMKKALQVAIDMNRRTDQFVVS